MSEAKDDKDLAQANLSKLDVRAGQIYRHYKGGLYTVVAVALKEDTLETLVIYQSNLKGSVWARTLANFEEDLWFDNIPGPIRRFARECD